MMKQVYIQEIEVYLPDKRLTNEDLASAYPEWTAEKIYQKTGIRSRPIVDEGTTALDLAERACQQLFARDGQLREQVDFLILMTESPDYKLPPSACILQDRLGLRKGTGAFDINLGCSAYIYGLAVAKALVAAGIAHTVLLVTAETYSKYIHPLDKSTRTLFGDAASATVISGHGRLRIGEFDLGTDGSGSGKLIVPAGMARMPSTELTRAEETDGNGYVRSKEHLFMDGAAIFSFAIDVVPKTVKALLAKSACAMEEIDLFVFHQANAYMLAYLRKKLRIPEERFYTCLENTGNTVSSSIPLALLEALKSGAVPKRGHLVLAGFGVGLSWGSVLLTMEENDD